MTPDESSSTPLDEHVLAKLMACDELLHVDLAAKLHGPADLISGSEADEWARSRLLLLLSMLEAAEIVDGGPRTAGESPAAPGPTADRPILGRFEVLDDLGSGGFGFVVRARDQLLGRIVALKMPLPGRILSPGDADRFLNEARATARLDHPHIVRVFDAGAIGPLGYFIASEFCQGPSLRLWLKGRTEPVLPRLAARWIADLADAVQHAHDRGILHRDVKPDNVMMTGGPGPDQFIPRLTDFGLAKILEEAGNETGSEAKLGTPQYMAPEQAAGRRGEIGPVTDVYALGATLYEILIGRPPFGGETDAETVRLVLEREPVSPRSLRPGLPRDLETICLKCLRKEPARRYQRAGELRDDLHRFLDGRPIVGRPVSHFERGWNWAWKRPGVAALIALVGLLVGGLIAGGIIWNRWLEWHSRQLEAHVARADREAREAERHRLIADERLRLAEHHDRAAGLHRAKEALEAGQWELAQDILHDVGPGTETNRAPSFPWRYLWRQAHRDYSQLWGHEADTTTWAFAPHGRALATRDLQGKILIWDLAPAMALDRPRALSPPAPSDGNRLSFSADGRLLLTLDQKGSSAGLRAFDSATGQPVFAQDCGRVSWCMGPYFDVPTRRLAILANRSEHERSVLCWNVDHGGENPQTWSIEDGTMFCEVPAIAAVVAVRGGRGRLLDPFTGKPRTELAGPPPRIGSLVGVSADGKVLAAQTDGNSVSLWDTISGSAVATLKIPPDTVGIALGPRGSRLAMLTASGRVRIFDRSTGQERELTAGPGRVVRNHVLCFSSDESLLLIGQRTTPGGLQPPEVWDVGAGKRIAVFSGRNPSLEIAFLPGRRCVLVVGGDRPRIWRLDPPSELDELAGHSAEAWAASFSPDGKILATASDDTGERQTIKLWDAMSGRLHAGWKAHTATVSALAFSPNGRLLASGSLDAGDATNPNLILWDLASRKQFAVLRGHQGTVRSVVFSPDGKTLATAGEDAAVRLWGVASKTARCLLTGHSKRITSVAFSLDGRLLASGSCDATVRVWDASTCQTRVIFSDGGNVNAIAFAPTGAIVASANEEGEIKLWDIARGELVRTLRGESDALRTLAFTPDGRSVVAAGDGKVIRIWDLTIGHELIALEGHKARVNALAFSPDGTILGSCSHDGAVKLWRAGPIEAVPAQVKLP